jgi:NAD+ dependent glucose-6-phosphate dehydrogenase
MPQRVLVTGAEGLIGSAVRRHLRDRYELRSLTKQRASFPSFVADIADFDAIGPAFESVDSVVHLAASPAVDASWSDVLRNNVIGTRNVFEAARAHGVERVVFASSNHAVGMYELDAAPEIYALDDTRVIDESVEPRPDSLYGVSKVFGEALGRFYADIHGLRVVCLRIGAVRRDDDPCKAAERERLRALWLSQRDCAELIASVLDADVRFAIVYGISDNPRQFFSLGGARALGFEPRDRAPVECPESGAPREVR